MNILDIITKKKDGYELTDAELKFAFNGYLEGEIPDYQMSSLLMAICIQGMSEKETFLLTDIFLKSGEVLDLSSINGVIVDKHSTGGVGDKTTLIIGPIVASVGLKFAKMSGRGLGFTGGTIDKLESIPGFKVSLTKEEMIRQVNKIGIAITSQTGDLVPLDKKVYALRDVTGTVESIPLIASSIMSKKIASGADNIMLDVKVGRGALLKTKEDALKIAKLMKKIGAKYKRRVDVMITYMDIPLGTSIGNTLEVVEVMKILKGEEDNYLVALSKSLAAKMIAMGLDISFDDAMEKVEEVLKNGKAYEKFVELIETQGGDLSKLKISKNIHKVYATKSGHIIDMDAYKFGKLSLDLGGGRKTKDEKIDPSVGIVLNKKIGDDVKVGDVLCTICLKEKEKRFEYNVESFYTFDTDKLEEVSSFRDSSDDEEVL